MRATNSTDVATVVKLRLTGRSDRQVAEILGLTKGQVAGLYFRATSPKYEHRPRATPADRLRGYLAGYVKKHGEASARAIVRQIFGSFQ